MPTDKFTSDDIIATLGGTETIKLSLHNIAGTCDEMQQKLIDKWPHTLWTVYVGKASEADKKKTHGFGIYVSYMQADDLSPGCYFWEMKIRQKPQNLLPPPNPNPSNITIGFPPYFPPANPQDSLTPYRESMKKVLDFIKMQKAKKDGID